MTSDAKIGLLLGLVFIFVIAFIINGLPNLRGEANNNELTTNMVNSGNAPLGVADKERKAQETLNWTELQQKPTLDANQPNPALADEKGDVRFALPLPGSSLAAEPNQTGQIDPNAGQQAAGPIAGAGVAQDSRLAKGEPAKVTPAKVYVVKDGDVLENIAKKVYGPAEGNKPANVTRIFEANRKQLKSPHEIQVGQKLVIPPLPAAKEKAAGVLSGPAFERVESVGERHVQPSSKEAVQTRWYVVRDGDNLWKIAAAQLGNGSRYSEIAKLNADVVRDQDNLVIGTRLRMPAR